MCQVVCGRDRYNLVKGRLHLRIPLDRFRHCKVVELVREHDRSALIEGAVAQLVQQALIVGVDLISRDRRITGVDTPIIRVGLPKNASQVQGACDDSDPIVDIAEGRSPEVMTSIEEKTRSRH